MQFFAVSDLHFLTLLITYGRRPRVRSTLMPMLPCLWHSLFVFCIPPRSTCFCFCQCACSWRFLGVRCTRSRVGERSSLLATHVGFWAGVNRCRRLHRRQSSELWLFALCLSALFDCTPLGCFPTLALRLSGCCFLYPLLYSHVLVLWPWLYPLAPIRMQREHQNACYSVLPGPLLGSELLGALLPNPSHSTTLLSRRRGIRGLRSQASAFGLLERVRGLALGSWRLTAALGRCSGGSFCHPPTRRSDALLVLGRLVGGRGRNSSWLWHGVTQVQSESLQSQEEAWQRKGNAVWSRGRQQNDKSKIKGEKYRPQQFAY